MGAETGIVGTAVIEGSRLLVLLGATLISSTPGAVTDAEHLDEDRFGGDDFRCGRKSPSFERLGDAYPDFSMPERSPEDVHGTDQRSMDESPHRFGGKADRARAPLRNTLDALSSASLDSGSGYRVQCRGSADDVPAPVLWQFDLQQIERVETLSGTRMITAFEERFAVIAPSDDRLVEDALVAEVMTLPDVRDWQPDATGQTLRSARRLRRPDHLLEIGWTLAPAGANLELAQTFYTNGLASERAVWWLSR